MLLLERAGRFVLGIGFAPFVLSGVRAPARLPGRLADPKTRLARLLGRLDAAAEGGRSSADAGRSAATDEGRGMPKERRLMPLSLLLGVSDATSEVTSNCEPMLLLGRFMLLRIVTEDGRLSPRAAP